MKHHKVRSYKSAERLDRADQLAWKIAAVAADPVRVEADVAEMIVNRIIDNAAVRRRLDRAAPVATARAQARAHPQAPGATVFGLPSGQRYQPNGRPGPTASRSASSISTTPFSPPTIRTPATTFRRCWRWRSNAAVRRRSAARHRRGL